MQVDVKFNQGFDPEFILGLFKNSKVFEDLDAKLIKSERGHTIRFTSSVPQDFYRAGMFAKIIEDISFTVNKGFAFEAVELLQEIYDSIDGPFEDPAIDAELYNKIEFFFESMKNMTHG